MVCPTAQSYINNQKYELFLTAKTKKLVVCEKFTVCGLNVVPLFSIILYCTVLYASAPVALEHHPFCCYNTALEVSADNTITFPLTVIIILILDQIQEYP